MLAASGVGGNGVGAFVGTAVLCRDDQPSPVFEPPANSAWVACRQRRLLSVLSEGARPGETNSVVLFWVAAPRARCGKPAAPPARASSNAKASSSTQWGPAPKHAEPSLPQGEYAKSVLSQDAEADRSQSSATIPHTSKSFSSAAPNSPGRR
eukprot:4622563-Pleurochrysis_carterae.AAC.1